MTMVIYEQVEVVRALLALGARCSDPGVTLYSLNGSRKATPPQNRQLIVIVNDKSTIWWGS